MPRLGLLLAAVRLLLRQQFEEAIRVLQGKHATGEGERGDDGRWIRRGT
ncbi:MAG: hypothetical protein IIB88_08530 [Chloroflexi bacterium]|nr:hypothetical protein [Chloroflexota bacterium]